MGGADDRSAVVAATRGGGGRDADLLGFPPRLGSSDPFCVGLFLRRAHPGDGFRGSGIHEIEYQDRRGRTLCGLGTGSWCVEGKYPLFDAEFEHQDVTVPLPNDGAAALEAWRTGHLPRLQGGTLHMGIMVQRGLISLRPEETYKKLKLTTFARNGQFVQNTELKRDSSGRWEMHYKVLKVIPGQESKLLKED